MPRNRKGVTLFEIMTVVTLAAIMMVMALPRLTEGRRAAAMAAARVQVESYLTTARAIAVRNAGKTQLVKSGNTLMIQADTGTGWITVVKPLELEGGYVKIKPSVNTIAFDSRGLATGLSATGEKFYLKIESGYGEGLKDSVCITHLGGLLDRKCGSGGP